MIFKKNLSYSVYTAWRRYSTMREARILNKLIVSGEKKRLKKQSLPSSLTMNDYAKKILYSKGTKRTAALNKVFMEHVSDLILSGEYTEELDKWGIQILKAKISPSMHVLFVYWIHTKPIVEEEVLSLLTKVAVNLRFELATLKVMGKVPEIRFAKHESLYQMETVNKILQDLTAIRLAEEEELKKIEKEELEKENIDDDDDDDDDLSKLKMIISKVKQNVFGLDHAKILENIMKEKIKSGPFDSERRDTLQISAADSEKVKFDKKILSKMIFKEIFELKKQRRLNRQLRDVIEERQYSDSDDEVEDYWDTDEENEENCEGQMDEEIRRILTGDLNDDDTDGKTE